MIVLIGESGSGKSSIEKELCKDGFQKVVSVTTRPMRPGEVNGTDYQFVTDKEFGLLQDELMESVEFRGWRYGILKKDFDPRRVVVVELGGLQQIARSIGRKNLKVFYIKVPERTRMIRMLKRGDDVDEVIRRVQADRQDFTNAVNLADYVIENKDLAAAVSNVKGAVMGSTWVKAKVHTPGTGVRFPSAPPIKQP